jgi:hypothetical protein
MKTKAEKKVQPEIPDREARSHAPEPISHPTPVPRWDQETLQGFQSWFESRHGFQAEMAAASTEPVTSHRMLLA